MNVIKPHVSLNISNIEASVAFYERAFGVVLHQLLRGQPDEVPDVTCVSRRERPVCLKGLFVLPELLVTLRRRIQDGGIPVRLRSVDDALVLAGFEQLLHL